MKHIDWFYIISDIKRILTITMENSRQKQGQLFLAITLHQLEMIDESERIKLNGYLIEMFLYLEKLTCI